MVSQPPHSSNQFLTLSKFSVESLNMKTITAQKNGSVWRIFVKSPSEEVEGHFNSLFNWGAIESRDDIDSCSFCSWTSEKKMMDYFVNVNLFKILNANSSKFKGRRSGAVEVARGMAELDMQAIQIEPMRSYAPAHVFSCFERVAT